MAHYAILDDDNIVTQVITGREEDDVDDLPAGVESWEAYYSQFHGRRVLRTSYNTLCNQHLQGGTPFRGNYAGIGYRYDDALDAFIPPQPFPSWTWNATLADWEAPTPVPDGDGDWAWSEDTLTWVAVNDTMLTMLADLGHQGLS